MRTLLLLFSVAHGIVACGQAGDQPMSSVAPVNKAATNEPPVCTCCVFDEPRQSLNHQLKIASDTATGQRIIIRGIVYQSDGKTPAPDVKMYF
ncbi:MAG TPA: hypothetical protein VEY06_05870, partial [Flavisolibacter sp.]|nr:hypothetical protein [Flavisolibacter sp.]